MSHFSEINFREKDPRINSDKNQIHSSMNSRLNNRDLMDIQIQKGMSNYNKRIGLERDEFMMQSKNKNLDDVQDNNDNNINDINDINELNEFEFKRISQLTEKKIGQQLINDNLNCWRVNPLRIHNGLYTAEAFDFTNYAVGKNSFYMYEFTLENKC